MTDEEVRRLIRQKRAAGERIDLSGEDLSGAYLVHAELGGANLANVRMSEANLLFADLSQSVADGADFRSAALFRADFSYASLKSADFRNANLVQANFSYADLTDADLTGAAIFGAEFRGARAKGALLPEGITISTDLSSENIEATPPVLYSDAKISDSDSLEYSGDTLANLGLASNPSNEINDDGGNLALLSGDSTAPDDNFQTLQEGTLSANDVSGARPDADTPTIELSQIMSNIHSVPEDEIKAGKPSGDPGFIFLPPIESTAPSDDDVDLDVLMEKVMGGAKRGVSSETASGDVVSGEIQNDISTGAVSLETQSTAQADVPQAFGAQETELQQTIAVAADANLRSDELQS
ncbi:MAG: pentapeptide repeat-containing protein, partial [Bacteroidia bacterium]|nr:pentapeptide repeat-containing protein [Bacteroidia bacterium]